MDEAVAALNEINIKGFKAPKDLQRRVRKLLNQRHALRWDAALAEIIQRNATRKGAE